MPKSPAVAVRRLARALVYEAFNLQRAGEGTQTYDLRFVVQRDVELTQCTTRRDAHLEVHGFSGAN